LEYSVIYHIDLKEGWEEGGRGKGARLTCTVAERDADSSVKSVETASVRSTLISEMEKEKVARCRG
jgi:hypothetical protein